MICRTGQRSFVLSMPKESPEDAFDAFLVEVAEASDADTLDAAIDKCTDRQGAMANGQPGGNIFDQKTDKGSADLYFYYYGMFQHQQNMLQDMVRTGTYHRAITENIDDFAGKVVMDVGAGSSILSQFAAQAGARKVYAVEASPMAQWAAKLCRANPLASKVVEIVHGKVEAISLDEKVDVLISEPMGTLLVNERMLESYIYARDHFLKPGGQMFPAVGRIHLAAFCDPILHAELAAKSLFWTTGNFYGVNLSSLHQEAASSFFHQVVVDAFDPSILVSQPHTHVVDFRTVKEEELLQIRIPLDLGPGTDCVVHGIASWFDVLFDGTNLKQWLSTAPGQPTTHWFQLRCVLQTPLHLRAKQKITGEMVLKAHSRQSYDIQLILSAPPLVPGGPPQKSAGVFDLKDPYYRQLTTAAWQQTTAQQQQPAYQGYGHPYQQQQQQQQQHGSWASQAYAQPGYYYP